MPEIIPIRDLKNTTEVSKKCHRLNEPLFITKNGYGDMVLMSIDYYDNNINGIEKNGVHSFNEIVKVLYPVFSEFNIKSAIIFGSYAKGLATINSDIDILVDSGLRGLAFYGLLDAICEAVKIDVDLIDVRDVIPGSKIDCEIRKSGVRIYG